MLAKFWRKWHKWVSIIVLIPFMITIITGVALLFRGNINWLSPQFPETSGSLQVSFEQILKASQSVPEMQINSWADVNRIQINPEKGSIVVRGKNNYQIQIDGGSGEVNGAGPLRTPLFVSLHEGTFWTGKSGRFIIGLPMALAVLFLSVSGLVLFFQPSFMRKALQKKVKPK